MKIWIGTSGWSYSNWKGKFYPSGMKPAQWLTHYAKSFNSVELNNSFYVLPKLGNLQAWHDKVPADFIFSIKAWGLITHRRKLKNCEDNIASFFENIKALGNKCGPILFQLPRNFGINVDRLAEFISLLPKGSRYVFEFRNPSWWNDEVFALLKEYNIAFCLFELEGLAAPKVVTADFIYIRLHGPQRAYQGEYSKASLLAWAKWLKAQGKDVYFYFDNTDGEGHAVGNARQLADIFGFK